MLVLMFALVAGCATVHRSPEGELSSHTYAGPYGARLMLDGDTVANIVEQADSDMPVAVSTRVVGVGGRSSTMTVVAGGTPVQYGPGVSPEGLSALAYRQRFMAEYGAPQTGVAPSVRAPVSTVNILAECPTGRPAQTQDEWNACQDKLLMSLLPEVK